MVPDRLGAIGAAGQMNIHDELEIFHRHLVEALVAEHTGIVDENIDMAPFGDRVGDHLFDGRHIGHAAAGCHGFAAFGFDFGNNLFGHGSGPAGAIASAAKVVYHHLDTAPRQFLGMLASETSACAGDDGDAVVKFYSAHGKFLSD